MIFDTHAHYDDACFDENRDALLKSFAKHGIGKVCNIGASMRGAIESAKLAEKYPFVYAAVGIHPDECLHMEDSWLDTLRELLQGVRVQAVGEIGLDYHGFDRYEDKPSKEIQMKWFRAQLELALELRKPVVIHSRNAAEDTMTVLKEFHARGLKDVIVHCYSYSQEIAKEYVAMGYMLGFGGTTTYEGQKKLTKVLSVTPLEHMLLETDSPYLAPVPYRYEINTSLNLPLVVEKIASIKGVTGEEIEAATWANAHRIYRIEE